MTFISPFDSLGENIRASEAKWELYTGSFACQQQDCWKVASEAKFFPKEKLLTWKCSDGHISRIEDYNG